MSVQEFNLRKRNRTGMHCDRALSKISIFPFKSATRFDFLRLSHSCSFQAQTFKLALTFPVIIIIFFFLDVSAEEKIRTRHSQVFPTQACSGFSEFWNNA